MNLKYTIGKFIAIPLLPLLYVQGKRIRKEVPSLPEAIEPEGEVLINKNEDKFRLLVIGESTVAGVGVKTHQEGFAGTLAEELAKRVQKNIEWRVYARSGYTAKRVTFKIVPKISETTCDIIVIGLGGNDAFKLNSLMRWNIDIQYLIDTLRDKFGDVPIYFTNMPPIKEFPAFTKAIKFIVGNLVELLGDELHALVSRNKNVFYDSEVITIEEWTRRYNVKANKTTFFSDGVHPSKFTYQIWAKNMAQFISDNLTTAHPKKLS